MKSGTSGQIHEKRKGITMKEKVGYGIASLGDTVVYDLPAYYGLYFMTEAAGLSSLSAGNVMSIASVWNAAAICIVGYLSDHHPLHGRRRIPYMKAAVIPMTAALVMFFTVTGLSGTAAGIYYAAVLMIVMTAHSFFMVPYESMGGDLTVDHDERTALRSYVKFFMGLGSLAGISSLLPGLQIMQNIGLSEKHSWQAVVLMAAILSAVSGIITCTVLKEEPVAAAEKRDKNTGIINVIKEYLDVLKLKPFLLLLLNCLLVIVASTFVNSGMAYFMQYNMGISAGQKGIILVIVTLAGIAMTPFLARLSVRFDKKTVMICAYLIAGAGLLVFRLIGITSTFALCIHMTIFTAGTSAYWQLFNAFVYDVRELDEVKNNRERGAVLLSASKIAVRLSSACGVQLLALLLFVSGYNQEEAVQGPRVLHAAEAAMTTIPAVLFICAALCMIFYPLTRKVHEALVEQLERR